MTHYQSWKVNRKDNLVDRLYEKYGVFVEGILFVTVMVMLVTQGAIFFI